MTGARAEEERARLAYSSNIDGVNTTVARLSAELADAQDNSAREQVALDIRPATDAFGSLECPAPREDRQPSQEHALGFGQELMAPIDQGADRLVPRQDGPTAKRQQP